MSLTHGGFFEICVIRVDNCEIGSFQGKSTRITKKIEKCLSRHKKIIKTKHGVTNRFLVKSSEHFWFLRRLKRMECARPQPPLRGSPFLVWGASDPPLPRGPYKPEQTGIGRVFHLIYQITF